MTRFTMKLLAAMVVVGCGSSAMASPSRSSWPDYDNQPHTSPDQTQAANQASPAQPAQYAQASDPWDDQSQAVPTQPAQPSQPAQPPQPSQPAQPSQPSQGQAPQPQNPWDQDQDEDSAQTFSWSAGQSHLGVMVIGLTPELRMHFGAPSNLGVLIARVEPSSAASRAGIQVGDVVVRVGRTQVRAGDDVLQALAAHGGGRIMISVLRQGQYIRIGAMLPGHPQQQQPQPQPQAQPPAGTTI